MYGHSTFLDYYLLLILESGFVGKKKKHIYICILMWNNIDKFVLNLLLDNSKEVTICPPLLISIVYFTVSFFP